MGRVGTKFECFSMILGICAKTGTKKWIDKLEIWMVFVCRARPTFVLRAFFADVGQFMVVSFRRGGSLSLFFPFKRSSGFVTSSIYSLKKQSFLAHLYLYLKVASSKLETSSTMKVDHVKGKPCNFYGQSIVLCWCFIVKSFRW